MEKEIITELQKIANPEKVETFKRFFKTGKGEYGEGDQFLGLDVPSQRKVAKKYYKDISLKEVETLMKNKYHEVRMTALLILTYKIKKAHSAEQQKIFDLYLKNTKYINNWDLVDVTAPNIVGYFIYENNYDRSILYKYSNNDSIWDKRIAILSTYYFIKHNEFKDTIAIAETLISHEHDLIHKAVGWMLREIGNRDYKVEYNYLKKHYKMMPRTMLRYAIEKFDPNIRQKFLKGLI